MRAVIAHSIYEANTFSPIPSGVSAFRDGGTWCEGEPAVRRWMGGVETQLSGSVHELEAAGWTAAPVLAAICGSPGGRLTAACWAELRAAFARRIAGALPADAVILHLHGAASAEGEDDVEGALLELVRRDLGFRGRLVLSLDLHANLTRRMIRSCDAITAYRTMPHVDFADTGRRAARLAMDPRPSSVAAVKLRALISPMATNHIDGGFAELLALARAEEGGDIDDVALLPVQPWLDVAEQGTAVAVTGRGSAPAAAARRLAERWWAQRATWTSPLIAWDEAIRRLSARRAEPWVLVDCADATTGGSPGDSCDAVERLLPLADALPGEVLLHVVDAATVAAARGGARRFRLGRQRLALDADVAWLGDGAYRSGCELYRGQPFSMGDTAVLARGRLRVLVSSAPTMLMDHAFYECAGLRPREALAVQSKSIMSWRAAFDAAPERGLYVAGPGCTSLDFARLPFTGERRGLFPLVAEPAEPIADWA